MRHLLLMRHAKAEPGGPGAADRDRPLALRGRRNAALIGQAIASQGMMPDLVLCSPAIRTRQTLDAILPYFAVAPRTMFDDTLYGTGETDYLRSIAESGGSARRLLVIGHNPTIHATAIALTGSGDGAVRARLAGKFPTAALAIIAFSGGVWSKALTGAGELLSLLVPRDLGADAGGD
jgi:phosphohistidine phosphatase